MSRSWKMYRSSSDDIANATIVKKEVEFYVVNTDKQRNTHNKRPQCGFSKYTQTRYTVLHDITSEFISLIIHHQAYLKKA